MEGRTDRLNTVKHCKDPYVARTNHITMCKINNDYNIFFHLYLQEILVSARPVEHALELSMMTSLQ